MGSDESVPFMKPLDEAKIEELNAAEKAWSGWLAMEDWMVGPRAPEEGAEHGRGQADGGAERSSRNDHAQDGQMGGNDRMADGVNGTFGQS